MKRAKGAAVRGRVRGEGVRGQATGVEGGCVTGDGAGVGGGLGTAETGAIAGGVEAGDAGATVIVENGNPAAAASVEAMLGPQEPRDLAAGDETVADAERVDREAA
jgi:hypothetical protein